MASKTSSAAEKTKEPASVKYMVLALGLLIGFVFGFVLLLSSLPVDDSLADFNAREAEGFEAQKADFEFYKMLPGKVVQPAPAPRFERVTETAPSQPQQTTQRTQAVIPPKTRVVPANAQNLSPGYTEVPANFKTQSFYLQAGSFRQPAEAETMRAKVLLLGLEAFIVTREEPGGGIRHRVRVGPYQDQSLLTEAKKRLRRGQIRYDVVRVTS